MSAGSTNSFHFPCSRCWSACTSRRCDLVASAQRQAADAGGVRSRRVVNEGDLLRVGMEVGGHVRAGRFEPLAKSVARLVRDVDVALAGASCLLLPGTRMLTLGLGRSQGARSHGLARFLGTGRETCRGL